MGAGYKISWRGTKHRFVRGRMVPSMCTKVQRRMACMVEARCRLAGVYSQHGSTLHIAPMAPPDTDGINAVQVEYETWMLMQMCGVDPSCIAEYGPIWNEYAHEAVAQLRRYSVA